MALRMTDEAAGVDDFGPLRVRWRQDRLAAGVIWTCPAHLKELNLAAQRCRRQRRLRPGQAAADDADLPDRV